jgi:hypothetical protein
VAPYAGEIWDGRSALRPLVLCAKAGVATTNNVANKRKSRLCMTILFERPMSLAQELPYLRQELTWTVGLGDKVITSSGSKRSNGLRVKPQHGCRRRERRPNLILRSRDDPTVLAQAIAKEGATRG